MAQATAGTATSQTITVSNGTTPYTMFNVSGFSAGGTGLTAANLTTNAAAGTVALSGTPTAAGTATFTVDVTDTAGATLSTSYTLTVNPALEHRTGRAGGRHRGDADQPDDHRVQRHHALHDLQCHGLRGGGTGLTAGESHDERGGGNGGAERHADGGGHGELHGQRHRHRRRDADARATR